MQAKAQSLESVGSVNAGGAGLETNGSGFAYMGPSGASWDTEAAGANREPSWSLCPHSLEFSLLM